MRHLSRQLDEALQDYELAVRCAHPRLDWVYSNRSSVFVDKGEYEAAIEDCTRAIEINPTYANAYANRAGAYYRLGNIKQTILDLEKYLEVGKREPTKNCAEIQQWLVELKQTRR